MEEQNNTPLARMQKLESMLDEYEGKIGLSQFQEQGDNSVKKYLSMTREQMEKLSPIDCAEIAITLGGFSFYLQRCYNRETARVDWASNVLKQIISGKEQQFRGSWESQFSQAINNDDYASSLLKLKNYAQQRANRITYLASSCKHMSELYKNLQLAKAMK